MVIKQHTLPDTPGLVRRAIVLMKQANGTYSTHLKNLEAEAAGLTDCLCWGHYDLSSLSLAEADYYTRLARGY